MQKLITFTVPCYNSAAYMDTCINSLLACGRQDVEIIIVDDGSTKDDTAMKADAWAAYRPDVIRAIHKENGGHGSAVNAGLAQAQGMYFKVVDSDDWLDKAALAHLMEYLEQQPYREQPTDLIVANYVYEKIFEGTQKVMDSVGVFPEGREITWEDMGSFSMIQYLHMHAVIYRTQLLRDIDLVLPEHCFYVDNLYAYKPLPHVSSIYYMNENLYRYFIGREGQSVGVDSMLARIDQHITVTRAMIDAVRFPDDVPCEKLFRFMSNHIAMMMCVCAIFLRMRNLFEDDQKLKDIWDYLHKFNPELFFVVKKHPLVIGTNIPTRLGRFAGLQGYKIAQKLFSFN